ncbi:MAG: pyruvate dehydrogenase (acetyl-transferring), homodimeric type, partial [Candidatus Eisenbacteria bacterium]|nr:pyruvate dehydrogenase (acetyl-transferring), homodimeric type [Candidatus Eisenbacteria bacterium]
EEVQYLLERRRQLGGALPKRMVRPVPVRLPGDDLFEEFRRGTVGSNVQVSTATGFVRMLRKLLKDPEIGRRIVPIIPDEGRTFGIESLFREFKIYSALGQRYKPVDYGVLMSYAESKDGQILEEGITEAGSMAMFTAAGTSYATHRQPMIPFFIFYSMFGFQRVGDLIWAFGDARGRGFLLGGTAGRTTLNGEGLQHEDGHSLVLASVNPACLVYDPAWAYEVATIVQEGMARMYERNEDVFYYITLYNENFGMPAMPEGAREGILRGLYLYRRAPEDRPLRAQLFGSGTILPQALRAQEILQRFGVAADVWSATSYVELRREALDCERWNRLHPDRRPRVPYVTQLLDGTEGPVVAASDFMKQVPDMVGRWIPRDYVVLGTDGFGRSDTREAVSYTHLRAHETA